MLATRLLEPMTKLANEIWSN